VTWTDPVMLLGLAGFALAAWLPPRGWQGAAMSLVGLVFLGACDPRSLLLLGALGAGTYALCGLRRPGVPGLVLTVALALGTLAAFKGAAPAATGDGGGVLVPLGLSYYTLRMVHVAWERYRGGMAPLEAGPFARYLLFFPTLVAGPIHRFGTFARDDRRRRWDAPSAARGLERLLYGSVKIVFLGNYLAVYKVGGFLASEHGLPAGLAALLGCLAYGANLYFQFAGYSDLAVGLAMWAGFRIEENFRWPFLACDLADFWRRWHITLSEWCRDYVFAPVAATGRSPYVGVLASMLVLGLWHEFSARYALWGLYHGAGIALCQAWKRRVPAPRTTGTGPRLRRGAAWLLTQGFVVLGFAFTRGATPGEAFSTVATIFGF